MSLVTLCEGALSAHFVYGYFIAAVKQAKQAPTQPPGMHSW